jgi:hypothetical protein
MKYEVDIIRTMNLFSNLTNPMAMAIPMDCGYELQMSINAWGYHQTVNPKHKNANKCERV